MVGRGRGRGRGHPAAGPGLAAGAGAPDDAVLAQGNANAVLLQELQQQLQQQQQLIAQLNAQIAQQQAPQAPPPPPQPPAVPAPDYADALAFLVQQAPPAPPAAPPNPAAKWLSDAWDAVAAAVVRFAEAPQAHPREWANAHNAQAPRTVVVNIFGGNAQGIDLSLEKIDAHIKQPVSEQTIDELMMVATRISRYGTAMNLRPASMLNLALAVFRSHPSVEVAANNNRVYSIASLNALLSTVFSDQALVFKYLERAVKPRHVDREDVDTFMVRCLTTYASVAWYLQLTDVVRGIVAALPLKMWETSAATLKDDLTGLAERPDLQQLGLIYARHPVPFASLANVYYDRAKRAHVLAGAREERRHDAERPAPQPPVRERNPERAPDRKRAKSPKGRGDEKPKNPRFDKAAAKGGVGAAAPPPNLKCYACGETGHIAPNCTNKAKKDAYDAQKKAAKPAAATDKKKKH